MTEQPTPQDVFQEWWRAPTAKRPMDAFFDALTVAGYEVVPAGTATRLSGLTDAIGDPDTIRLMADNLTGIGWTPEAEVMHAIAAAVQPPDSTPPPNKIGDKK